MTLLVFLCLIPNILAYQKYDNFNGRNFNQRSISNEYLFNNNFSEDEMNAINEYKKGGNFRASARNKVFDPQFENRRIFGWIKKLLRKEEPKPIKYEDLVNNKIFYLHLTNNLTDNLGRLTNVLDKFTRALKEKSIINATLRRTRITRSLNDSEVLAENSTINKTIDKTMNVAPTEDSIATTKEIVSGRRNFNLLDLKHKLISSINDTLNIVINKLKTASNTREIFGDNLLFNIGFISGNIYTMKAFIDELQSTVGRNEGILDEKYIMQLNDMVNKVNEVSGKLLNQLNLFVDEATLKFVTL